MKSNELRYDQFSSVQLNLSVMANSATLWTAARQASGCPSPIPGVCSIHVHRVSDAIQTFHPLLSPSLLAFNLSQYRGLYQ